MFDIGLNLTNSQFKADRAEVMQRAKQVGLQGALLTGTCLDSSEYALTLAQQYQDEFSLGIFSTAGVHPHDAKDVDDEQWQALLALHQSKQVKAVGECGLDFNRNFSPQETQRAVFDRQLALAETLQKPLFMHCRDAFPDFLQQFKQVEKNVPASVIHCFTGDRTELEACLDVGLAIGITGWICDERRGAALRDLVAHIPLDALLIETDAPFLIPRNLKPKPSSRRNEPAYLAHIASEVAKIRQIPVEHVIEATTRNAQQRFHMV